MSGSCSNDQVFHGDLKFGKTQEAIAGIRRSIQGKLKLAKKLSSDSIYEVSRIVCIAVSTNHRHYLQCINNELPILLL